jgi:hypothetical protein
MLASILKVNSGECPLWHVDVSICGWYKEMEEHKWEFLRAVPDYRKLQVAALETGTAL